MQNIVYSIGEKIYLNITNECPCDCDFCVRHNRDGLGEQGTLWLDHTPTLCEIKKAVDDFDLSNASEVVFCGYGEPTCELENLLATAKYIKEKYPTMSIRINTNGLSDLINGREHTARELDGIIDTVSVSLNASNAENYCKIVHPSFGEKSFDAMIAFTKEARQYVKSVKMTVVDTLDPYEIKKCKEMCEANGINLRVREYVK